MSEVFRVIVTQMKIFSSCQRRRRRGMSAAVKNLNLFYGGSCTLCLSHSTSDSPYTAAAASDIVDVSSESPLFCPSFSPSPSPLYLFLSYLHFTLSLLLFSHFPPSHFTPSLTPLNFIPSLLPPFYFTLSLFSPSLL